MANGVTVHLIRHEKTSANLERKYIGRTDESIVPALPRHIPRQPEIVYGSGLKRCKETTQLYFPNAKYEADERFNELDFGDFEMKTYEQLKYLPAYRQWIDDPLTVTPPNGESFETFCTRVYRAFDEIVAEDKVYIFVVHGGVIRALMAKYAPHVQSFQEATAQHHTEYTMHWDSFKALKEGQRCTSYSEAFLTEKETM